MVIYMAFPFLWNYVARPTSARLWIKEWFEGGGKGSLGFTEGLRAIVYISIFVS
jgi:hypothetical protein